MSVDIYNTITHHLFPQSGIVVTREELIHGRGVFTKPFPHSLNRALHGFLWK